ncbi:amino acid ABC transporter substrate-binding protein [Bacillus sp. S3]|uniref:substrate-binding periplasmic protein n=1 Tax=Bacillus sp. S3 TaxID=486398 RepID=UPI001187E410|nr:transporter substrate-binding domain-containing protein [Bacillus sp. S3]QCJ44687.1 amino acid ABC transporter substrate-binding protein [Bacillus sp. S3]
MKKYLVGADPFPPYQFYNAMGVLEGSDYSHAEEIINKMGATAEYILDDWSRIEKKLIDKEIDIAFQVQKTPEREKLYSFSSLFRNAITTIISCVDEDLKSIEEIDLLDKKLAVIKGYKYGDVIDLLPERIKVYSHDQQEQVEFVMQNKADYAVVDLGVFEYQAQEREFEGVKILRHLDFTRPLYVVFNNPSVRDEFNRYL